MEIILKNKKTKNLILTIILLMILVACKQEQKPVVSDVEKQISPVVETKIDTIIEVVLFVIIVAQYNKMKPTLK